MVASKKTGLEVNADETTYMVMSWNQNSGWIHNIKIDNSSFERVKQSKYLGTTLTYQNSIQEEIKSRFKPGNACYHSVQNLLSFSLLSKNIKIKIQRTMILPVVVYERETWSLTLRKKRRLRVFENWGLTTIFGPKRDEIKGEWKKLHNEDLKDLYLPNITWVIKTRRNMWEGHVACMGKRRGLNRVLVEKSEGKSQLGRPRLRWDNIKINLQEVGWRCMDWTDPAQNRDRWQALLNAVINLWVP